MTLEHPVHGIDIYPATMFFGKCEKDQLKMIIGINQ